MFVGKQVRHLDDKGRLAIPAEYVDLLSERDRGALYLTPGKRGGIWLVPPSYYEGDFVDVVGSFEGGLPDEFFHVCQRRPLDKAGRILVDQDARALAGLGDPTGGEKIPVVICGSGRYLQVWPQAEYEQRQTPARHFAQNLPGGGNAFGRPRP
ncbi:MAG: Transcriptional regulator MraZ [Planctomycetes bacterium]|nr:Transcriptional regulator MraZ [Planctomycetota bacterium]